MLTVMRGADARLVETLNELGDRPEGWYVVVFHLSDLLEQYKSDYQVRIAVNMVNDLLKSAEGGIYVCTDGCIAVLCNDLSTQMRNKLIFQLRYLYMDDPLAYHADGSENDKFCSWYTLESEYRACLQYFTKRMTSLGRTPISMPTPSVPVQPVVAAHTTSSFGKAVDSTFSAQLLAGVEHDLAAVDISNAVRRQAICAFNASGKVQRVFDELYIHMPHLRELLRSEVDFLSNKWLFKYLTQLLDKRMLALLGADAQRQLMQPLSININVETLLSEAFATFDALLSPQLKVSIVFEIHAVDLFADTSAFLYATEQVQQAGYRVCLDGLTDVGFLQTNRARLGVDLVKLQWNADFADDVTRRENKPLREAVLTCGANRVILCRCDNLEAVEYGKALGISLFQGRYLDQIMNPTAKVKN